MKLYDLVRDADLILVHPYDDLQDGSGKGSTKLVVRIQSNSPREGNEGSVQTQIEIDGE